MPEEDQPLLVTFYANPATVADINAGRVDAAAQEALEWQSWARRRCADAARRPRSAAEPGAGAHLQRRQLLGAPGDRRSNAPADGTPVASPVDYVSFFQSKWCTEFTNLPSCDTAPSGTSTSES